MVKAVFPGTFDPPTNGHFDIIARGVRLFDSLDVVVAVNLEKTPLLSHDTRRDLLLEQVTLMGLKHVEVKTWGGLIVDYCSAIGAGVLLRGARSARDFDYEVELAALNKHQDGGIETVILPAESRFLILRSSTIRDLLKFGGDISGMVPPAVESALRSIIG